MALSLRWPIDGAILSSLSGAGSTVGAGGMRGASTVAGATEDSVAGMGGSDLK